MPETLDLKTSSSESNRISEWRANRLRAAETSKVQRLKERDTARVIQDKEKSERRQQEVEALLPDPLEMEIIAKSLKTYRLKTRLMFGMQFLVIVLAPLALAAFYYFTIATPLFQAQSVIAISRVNGAPQSQNAGFLGTNSQTGPVSEVFMAHEFIGSQALMDGLEEDRGWISTLSGEGIDPVARLRDVQAIGLGKHAQFDRYVTSTVDIQTGLLTIYVNAPNANDAIDISNLILARTGDQINALSASLLQEQVALAERGVDQAQVQLKEAHGERLAIQIASGDVNPKTRVAAIHETIRQLEVRAETLATQIEKSQVAGIGQSVQTNQALEIERRVRGRIAEQRSLLSQSPADGSRSLNEQLMEFELANLSVNIAEKSMSDSLESLAETRTTATLGQSVFQVVVPPKTAAVAVAPNPVRALVTIAILLMAVFLFVRLLGAGQRSSVS